MAKTNEELSDEVWKKFLRRHWKMTIAMAGGIAGAAIVALFVFLWVVADAQATGLVPAALGQWTVGYFFTFILNVILWELVFVGSWGIPIVVVIFFQWYKKLPDEEREEYEGEPKKKRPRRGMSGDRGGGFISFLVGLTWLILVWIEGRWNLAFQAWTFNDWIYSWIAAALWDLLILGVPVAIFIIWWIRKEMKKVAKPSQFSD